MSPLRSAYILGRKCAFHCGRTAPSRNLRAVFHWLRFHCSFSSSSSFRFRNGDGHDHVSVRRRQRSAAEGRQRRGGAGESLLVFEEKSNRLLSPPQTELLQFAARDGRSDLARILISTPGVDVSSVEPRRRGFVAALVDIRSRSSMLATCIRLDQPTDAGTSPLGVP